MINELDYFVGGITMKNLLKLKSFIFIIGIVIVILYFQAINNSYSNVIYANWGIKLPKAYSEIYSAYSGASFHGDGQRYHIFQYKDKWKIDSSLVWKYEKNLDIEYEIIKILNSLNVSDSNMPDFKKQYKYYVKTKDDCSIIYLVFFNDTGKLYIIEDLF